MVETAIELEQLGRAVPIHFIGDSHAIIHHDMLYSNAPGNTRPTVIRTSYCSGVRASSFTGPAGALNPQILHALFGSLALFGEPSNWGRAQRDTILSDYMNRVTRGRERWGPDLEQGFVSPVVVMSIGSFDMWAILASIGPDGDFSYDSPRLPRVGGAAAPARRYFPTSLVRTMIDRALEPLFAGLRSIRDAGIEDLFLLGLAPPSLDMEGEYIERIGSAPIALRYKLAAAFNDRMAELCRRDNIEILDIWESVVGADGLVDDAFVFDFVHLNQRAARLTVRRLYEALAHRRDTA